MATTEWEWWCAGEGGRSPVEKEFGDLPKDVQGTFYELMEGWLDGVVVVDGSDCKSYGRHGVLYLRHRKGNNQYRVYFVVREEIAVAIHAAYKNTQKIDKQTTELLKARARGGSSKPST